MRYLLYLFPLLLLLGCGEQDNPLEPYYFPFEDLQQGRVYEYRPVNNDTLPPEYWYYRSFVSDTATVLAGQYIDHNFEVRQFTLEEKVSNGMLMQKCVLLLPDTSGRLQKVDAEILSGSVFPFAAHDSLSAFLYKIQFADPEFPERVTTLIRNRRYYGKTRCEVMGRERSCLLFRGRELLAADEEGVLELEYELEEHYAENLGLVFYRKEVSERFRLEYQLAATYDMQAFEAKFGPVLAPQQ